MCADFTPLEVQQQIANNELTFKKLVARFNALGFTSYAAMAQVIHDKTGAPYYQVHRALLYMASSEKYFALMQTTLDKLLEE